MKNELNIVKFFPIIILSFIIWKTTYSQSIQYAGLRSFDYYASQQTNSNWCWAASIQMILNFYGVDITQEQIVRRTYGTDPYGNLPNWTGNIQTVTRNLNNWNIDNRGNTYMVRALVYTGAPTPSYLIQELNQGRPVMIGYVSGQGSGHAVVITGAYYNHTPYGPSIQTLVVRDPWPSYENIQNKGRVEYPGSVLANRIMAHWYVRVVYL